jgi:predicted NAD-dependent protein-ADP-ribosyltransferase YbiA (DUF1768 family)
MDEITFTKVKLEWGWLGNMSPHPIEYDGKTWRTSEALFQSLRFKDEEPKGIIRLEKSPMGCKMKSKSLAKIYDRLVVPMSLKDIENMKMCVRLKLEQNPELIELLLQTGDKTIIEDATSRGRKESNLFWGAIRTEDGWEGENMMGKIWEDIRNEYII